MASRRMVSASRSHPLTSQLFGPAAAARPAAVLPLAAVPIMGVSPRSTNRGARGVSGTADQAVAAARDRLSRPLRDLRVSVTDRCNLRCSYCMPSEVFGAGFPFLAQEQLLSFEEIARLCRIFAEQGIRRIRLTGGEPLLRRKLEDLVALLAEIDGIEEIALTTNGVMLAAKARALSDAGLTRVTVSLDALRESVLRSISDRQFPLARVLAGIDAASEARLHPVKINMVVRRAVNDDCVLEMAEHFRHRGEILRFIEYMDVGDSNEWQLSEVVPAKEMRRAIESRWPLQPLPPTRTGEVASRWRYLDGAGEIGFIHSVSEPFCTSCNRARLSADGKLYTCLFGSTGADLREPLRSGAGDRELAQRIREIWRERADRYSAERAPPARSRRAAPSAPKIEMSYIGG
jgi:GTP 3',8-cyclase